jgi:hypothetical protein
MRTNLAELEEQNPRLRRIRMRARLRPLRRAVVVAMAVGIGWYASQWQARGGDEEHYATAHDGAAVSFLWRRIYHQPFTIRHA